jgi:hypothetical protein
LQRVAARGAISEQSLRGQRTLAVENLTFRDYKIAAGAQDASICADSSVRNSF